MLEEIEIEPTISSSSSSIATTLPSLVFLLKVSTSPPALSNTALPFEFKVIASAAPAEVPPIRKEPELFKIAFVEPSTLNCIAELDTAPSSSTPIRRFAPFV